MAPISEDNSGEAEPITLESEGLVAKLQALEEDLDDILEQRRVALGRPMRGSDKIGGTGAASIGEATVLAGSLMFDFNFELMARVLKVPSEKFRDKVYQSLQEYMTTIKRELGKDLDRQSVKDILIRQCQQNLGVEIEPAAARRKDQGGGTRGRGGSQSQGWTY